MCPFGIDEDALSRAKGLDLAKPPVRQIEHQEFPKVVYKHPKDKTKDHQAKTVANKHELAAAVKEGWSVKPHIPVSAETQEAYVPFETSEA